MGQELKRDVCPEKYYSKNSVFTDSLPTIIALIIVAFFSGSLFNESGMDIIVTILIESIFVILIYTLLFFLLKGMKCRLAETYISVCEQGICGICPKNGYKNKNFSLYYSDITKVVQKGERLFIYSQKGNVALTLSDAPGTTALIKSKTI